MSLITQHGGSYDLSQSRKLFALHFANWWQRVAGKTLTKVQVHWWGSHIWGSARTLMTTQWAVTSPSSKTRWWHLFRKQEGKTQTGCDWPGSAYSHHFRADQTRVKESHLTVSHNCQPGTHRLPVHSLTLRWPPISSLQVPFLVPYQLVQSAVKPVNALLRVIVSPLQKQLINVSHLQQQQALMRHNQ